MKHNYFKSLFTLLLLLCNTVASAHDFKVNGIYYNITDATNKTVEVTYKGSWFNEYSNEYTGTITIPGRVTYNGATYSVTTIGDDAFYNCTGLTSITIPNSVISIGNYVFCDCTGLTSVTIGNGVTTIGDNAFYECTGLTSIVVDTNNPVYDSRNNCNAIIETATNTLVVGCKNTIIPNSVTTIGDYAFNYCTGLTSIEIPNSVTSIGECAFSDCENLTSVTIPNSVTSIGGVAFACCDALTSIEIPSSVTSIKWETFIGCTGLTSVTIGNGVTTIENYAFGDCYALTSITIPNSVTTIDYCAFYNCTGLTSIEIPSSVTSIGNEAFSDCTGLTSITSLIPTYKLFAIEDDVFNEVDKTACTLYVPAGAKATYAATDGWKEFTNIVELEGDGDKIEATLNDGEAYTAIRATNCSKIAYNRTFNNTNWQAWYVPFAIDYNLLKDDFDVAEINDIHQYDDNRDGVMDRTELEVVKIYSGTLKANYPYLVRAKETGNKNITVENTILLVAEDVTIDCSSIKLKYYFTGTFSGVSGNEMYNNNYYALSGGAMMLAANNTVSLKPFRWYMKIEARNGASVASEIKIRLIDETTSIEQIEDNENKHTPVYYDLSGRRVENPTRGIYIVNGKKIFVK